VRLRSSARWGSTLLDTTFVPEGGGTIADGEVTVRESGGRFFVRLDPSFEGRLVQSGGHEVPIAKLRTYAPRSPSGGVEHEMSPGDRLTIVRGLLAIELELVEEVPVNRLRRRLDRAWLTAISGVFVVHAVAIAGVRATPPPPPLPRDLRASNLCAFHDCRPIARSLREPPALRLSLEELEPDRAIQTMDPADRALIGAEVREKQEELTPCASIASVEERRLFYWLELAWAIDATGHVQSAEIARSNLSKNAERCALETVQSWRFSATAGTVRYTFRFLPDSSS
jgi:TonB family protein